MDQLKMTVSELNTNMKKLLDSRPGLKDIWIQGEISNFKINLPSGHMYLTLKDEKSVLKACMFRGANQNLSFRPEDGMKVLARGRVSVYEPGGTYQLYIEELVLDGLGELYAAFNQLKEKLRAEGLFDEIHKKPIPEYPKKVGVITSDTGAAVRDIINVIKRRYPKVNIKLYPVSVQGKKSSSEICDGIRFFNNANNVDTIIIGRGGGSIEELWSFNEEEVAREIFKSSIPIISAVGHETDFTIADFVADMRAPTPSAAAEIATPSLDEVYYKLHNIKDRMNKSLNNKTIIDKQKIEYVFEKINVYMHSYIIKDKIIQIDTIYDKIVSRTNEMLVLKKEELKNSGAILHSLSPLSTMNRGYSIVEKNNDLIRSIKELKENDKVEVKLKDGSIDCIIEKIKVKEVE